MVIPLVMTADDTSNHELHHYLQALQPNRKHSLVQNTVEIPVPAGLFCHIKLRRLSWCPASHLHTAIGKSLRVLSKHLSTESQTDNTLILRSDLNPQRDFMLF